jgi:ribosomal subunit interface protein
MIRKIVKGTGITLTPAIDAAIDKVVESLDKYVTPADSAALVEIEVGKTTNHHRSGDIFRAEINFRSKIGNLRAEAEKEDLYVALGVAKDEILEILRSRKAKKVDVFRRSASEVKNVLKGLPWKGKK